MHAPNRLSWLVVIVVAGGVVGCATPAPLVSLAPRNASAVAWVSGRAVLAKELGGVRVATAFEQQDGGDLNLRVEVQNETGAAFEVDPQNVTYMTCATADNDSCLGSFAVADPEAVLASLDEQQSRTRATATNGAAFQGTLVLLSAVGDVATVASGHANSTTGLQTVALAQEGEASAADANASLMSLGSEREQWSNVALRRNTVASGHGVAGLISIPIDLKARYVWVHVRAGGQVFPFGFAQTVRQLQ